MRDRRAIYGPEHQSWNPAWGFDSNETELPDRPVKHAFIVKDSLGESDDWRVRSQGKSYIVPMLVIDPADDLEERIRDALRTPTPTIRSFLEQVYLGYLTKWQLEFVSPNQSALEATSPSLVVGEEVDQLFRAAADDSFEVGMESSLATGIQRIFDLYPSDLLRCLKKKIVEEQSNSDSLAESLRWAAHQECGLGSNLFVDFFCAALSHSSAVVRDAAALAFAYFDEELATEPIERAAAQELVPALRRDLNDLLDSLKG